MLNANILVYFIRCASVKTDMHVHSSTVTNNATNPSEEKSESVPESVESDFRPSSTDENSLVTVQPAT